MKKISIIVPCYNAENYLDRCMKSLIGQTIGIENMELIFVNDASTDNTFSVLQKWERQFTDSMILVDCKENGRQGRARNIGLSYASSPYIGFADNDDIAEPDMYEKLYEKAIAYKCDLTVCRSKKHSIGQVCSMGRSESDDAFLQIEEEAERLSFLNLDINKAIWNKLYKRELIEDNEIVFPEGTIYDDQCFSELIKHYANRIYILEEYLYHHILRDEAASNSAKDWESKLGWFDVQVIKMEELKKRGIYKNYEKRYQEEFLIDYITLVHNFIQTYSYIPPLILDAMKNTTVAYVPNYRRLPAVREIMDGKGSRFLQLLCAGFERQIEESYVEKLVEACQGEG